ncbi:MAG: malto-oligosyltrehalose synthase [Pirellulales bacterium]
MIPAAHTPPTATYRLQMHAHLRFEAARALVPYLAELGIGAAYTSPFLRARHGSSHGYDVVDHGQLDPSLGTDEEFASFAESLLAHHLGLVVDLVPNHMGIDDPNNGWWQDVLENGPASSFARFFDIDWNPPKATLQNKVLLPVLGEQFGRVLEDQQLRLAYEDQRFVIHYFERAFPTDPVSWVPILRLALDAVAEQLAADDPARMELESIITGLERVPGQGQLEAEAVQERYREKEVARRRLSALQETSEEVRTAIEGAVTTYNGQQGDSASFDRLEALLIDQPYRLCYWRVATDEINYRRFFDIDSLAAIRVEDPQVFAAIHEKIFGFVRKRWITGLRIDHADGLLDPQQYLSNLRAAAAAARSGDEQPGSVAAAPPATDTLYTVIEKILAHDEALPDDWPIDGTTGYEFLNLLNDVFVDGAGAMELADAYVRLTGQVTPFAEILYQSKRGIMTASLSAELYMLSHQLDRLSEHHRWSRDFTRLSMYRALREVMACFPVYRTYIRPDTGTVSDSDRWRILTAVRLAKRRNPAMSPSFFDFIASVLMLEDPEGLSDEARAERRQFVLKFQQVTGPVTAKGLEDTAFYRYYPLASLNEVGGDPTIGGATPELFHRRVAERAAHWPNTMNTTGTHDTKRGEDMRARLNVLSEIPEAWDAAVRRWQAANAASRAELDGAPVPDANEEYLIYQTLVGTWPLRFADAAAREAYVERIVAYLDKALREAKLHTSWLNPYEEYDQAVAGFIRAILADPSSEFLRDLDNLVRAIADAGFLNGLAQLLVKIASPGVPDFYQGTEFWDFNLVDPDNRRPVDFQARRDALAWLSEQARLEPTRLARELLSRWPDERIKMFVMWRALQFRSREQELFQGPYTPLTCEGPHAGQLLAFARDAASHSVLCIVPRTAYESWRTRKGARKVSFGGSASPWPLAPWWQETSVVLPAEAATSWRHVLTGHTVPTVVGEGGSRRIDVADLFRWFPVALLASGPA